MFSEGNFFKIDSWIMMSLQFLGSIRRLIDIDMVEIEGSLINGGIQ